jgi:DNA-binding LacI/PurR family transcriptional regulator
MYSALLQGFGDAASAHYHQPIVSNTADNLYKQGDEILQLIHKRVAGVAIVPVASAATPVLHIEVIQAANIPVVLLHGDVPGSTAPLVALPLENVGYQAGVLLLERGHRHVAVLAQNAKGLSSEMHVRGLRRAMQDRGLSLPEEYFHAFEGASPFSLSTLEAAVERAFARMAALPEDERPTALYATSGIIAEVTYMRLMRNGVRVPQDVSVISFGSQQRVGAIAPRLTSIVVDERLVGARAVELLGRCRSRDAASTAAVCEPRQIENVPISLTEGETLGPPRRRKK